MKMIQVNSSVIEKVGYENCIFILRYINGGVYAYSDVPKSVYEDFLNADSKGKFLSANIKPIYDYCKL